MYRKSKNEERTVTTTTTIMESVMEEEEFQSIEWDPSRDEECDKDGRDYILAVDDDSDNDFLGNDNDNGDDDSDFVVLPFSNLSSTTTSAVATRSDDETNLTTSILDDGDMTTIPVSKTVATAKKISTPGGLTTPCNKQQDFRNDIYPNHHLGDRMTPLLLAAASMKTTEKKATATTTGESNTAKKMDMILPVPGHKKQDSRGARDTHSNENNDADMELVRLLKHLLLAKHQADSNESTNSRVETQMGDTGTYENCHADQPTIRQILFPSIQGTKQEWPGMSSWNESAIQSFEEKYIHCDDKNDETWKRACVNLLLFLSSSHTSQTLLAATTGTEEKIANVENIHHDKNHENEEYGNNPTEHIFETDDGDNRDDLRSRPLAAAQPQAPSQMRAIEHNGFNWQVRNLFGLCTYHIGTLDCPVMEPGNIYEWAIQLEGRSKQQDQPQSSKVQSYHASTNLPDHNVAADIYSIGMGLVLSESCCPQTNLLGLQLGSWGYCGNGSVYYGGSLVKGGLPPYHSSFYFDSFSATNNKSIVVHFQLDLSSGATHSSETNLQGKRQVLSPTPTPPPLSSLATASWSSVIATSPNIQDGATGNPNGKREKDYNGNEKSEHEKRGGTLRVAVTVRDGEDNALQPCQYEIAFTDMMDALRPWLVEKTQVQQTQHQDGAYTGNESDEKETMIGFRPAVYAACLDETARFRILCCRQKIMQSRHDMFPLKKVDGRKYHDRH